MGIIEKWGNEYFNKDDKYKNHVSKFIKYLKIIGKDNRPVSVTIDDVIECIGHYNAKQKINTINSMENHLEAIKAFYKFLVSKDYASDIFSGISSFSSFKKEIIKKYELSEMVNKDFFDIDIIKEILFNLEGYFNSNSYNDLARIQQKNRYLKNVVLNMFIKITLIYPSKRNIICDLSMEDFNDDFRTLKANGLNISIPSNLRYDIKKSLYLAKTLLNREIECNEKIFNYIWSDSFRGEKINSWFCEFLKKYDIVDIPSAQNTYSSEVLMNTIIRVMIENMAHPAIISKISGLSLSTLDSKFYSSKDVKIPNENQIVNTEIIRVGLINYL